MAHRPPTAASSIGRAEAKAEVYLPAHFFKKGASPRDVYPIHDAALMPRHEWDEDMEGDSAENAAEEAAKQQQQKQLDRKKNRMGLAQRRRPHMRAASARAAPERAAPERAAPERKASERAAPERASPEGRRARGTSPEGRRARGSEAQRATPEGKLVASELPRGAPPQTPSERASERAAPRRTPRERGPDLMIASDKLFRVSEKNLRSTLEAPPTERTVPWHERLNAKRTYSLHQAYVQNFNNFTRLAKDPAYAARSATPAEADDSEAEVEEPDYSYFHRLHATTTRRQRHTPPPMDEDGETLPFRPLSAPSGRAAPFELRNNLTQIMMQRPLRSGVVVLAPRPPRLSRDPDVAEHARLYSYAM